jgi:hypothetical protein
MLTRAQRQLFSPGIFWSGRAIPGSPPGDQVNFSTNPETSSIPFFRTKLAVGESLARAKKMHACETALRTTSEAS